MPPGAQPPYGRHPRSTRYTSTSEASTDEALTDEALADEPLTDEAIPDEALTDDVSKAQPAARRAPSDTAALAAAGSPTRLTARGAVVAMFWLFLIGTLAAGWLHLGLLTGLCFVIGCGLTARYTRRDGLLTVVASPPLIFLVAVVIAETLTGRAGSASRSVESIAAGIFLTLAGGAPWLFAGVLLGLIVALARGLPQCFRDLSAELRGENPRSSDRPGRPGDRRAS